MKKPKAVLGYTLKDPPLLTKEAAKDAKLGYGDRKRKREAEEAAAAERAKFTNKSGRLRIVKPGGK